MKTKLLSSLFAMMLFSSFSNAQTKVWDFGNNRTTWPISSGITEETVVDNLGLFPISTNTNFGAITSNNTTFDDGYVGAYRFQMNGGGGVTAPVYTPVQRYVYFDVSGACQVKVWFKTGSNGSARTVFVTDGSAVVGSATTNSGSNLDTAIITANYTAAAGGRIYIYGDTACNLFKIQVTGATVNTTLAVDHFQTASAVNVFAKGKQITVSNVLSNTQIDIYSITGALVKSVKTASDISLDTNLTSGLYIVKVQSAQGQKAVKVAIQ